MLTKVDSVSPPLSKFFGSFLQKMEVSDLDKKLEMFESGVEYRFIVNVDGQPWTLNPRP